MAKSKDGEFVTPACELSIVIPAYQAEKYLGRCLASVVGRLACTTQVIVVDDASRDGTRSIARSFVQSHPREVQLLSHPDNLGVSASRNSGLAVAAGRLVMFLDADDWIDSQECMRLLELQERTGADLTCGNACIVSAGHDPRPRLPRRHGLVSLSPGKDLNALIGHLPLLDTCWGKLYQLRMIREQRLQFNANLKYGEDTLFANAAALAADTIAIDYDCRFYQYFQNDASCMQTLDASSRLQQLNALLGGLYELAPDNPLADHFLLRKAGEAVWTIRKYARTLRDRRALLRQFWASDAVRRGLYGCIARQGKWKQRLLWRLMASSPNQWDCFWLRWW